MERLSERDEKVLLAIIQTHIMSRCPVGSFKVKRRFSFNLSPATIRNTMAELEARGYVTQPHTSAGRIPTASGYRYYVDLLLRKHESRRDILEDLYKRLISLERDFHKMMIEASNALSLTTRYIGIVTPPRIDDIILKYIRLIRYDKKRVLCILVSEDGIVKNRMIRLDDVYPQRQLERITNYLNNRFGGKIVRDIKLEITSEISKEKVACDRLIRNALLTLKDIIIQEGDDIVGGVTGTSNLPDFVDVKQIKDILRVIEDKQLMLNILEKVSNSEGLRVVVGLKDINPSMKDMSMVVSTYTDKVNARGAIGVIGPTSMNYKKLIPIVEQTANTLTQVLMEG